MKNVKLAAIGAALLGSTALSAQAQELNVILCGAEVFQADIDAAAEFEKEEGVKVNLEGVPWGTCQDKALTLAAGGDPVDLAYVGSRTLKQLATNDLIVPVEIAADRQNLYQAGVLDTVTHDGQYWGLPHAFSTKALYMNCDLIEAAGQACEAPKTWDDMYNLAKAVSDNSDAAGVGLAGKDFDNTMHQFLNYLYSNGGVVYDVETGDVKLNSKEAIETLEFYGKLAEVSQDGPTAWERDELKNLFNDGKIAMYINGPWGRGQHKEEINQKIVPIPAGPSGDSGTILITDSMAVFKGTGNEELATKLARKMTSDKYQYSLDTEWGLPPIMDYTQLGWDKPYYQDDPFWAVYVNAIPAGGPEPLATDFKSLQGVFTNMVQGIILQDDTAENLVVIASEELEEIK